MADTPHCEVEDCPNLATYEVQAQWTLVDFGRWLCCDEDLDRVVEHLWKRYVDGQPAVDVWWTRFDDPSFGS